MANKGTITTSRNYKYYIDYDVIAVNGYDNVATLRCVYRVENVDRPTETHTFEAVVAETTPPYNSVDRKVSKTLTLAQGEIAEIGTIVYKRFLRNGGELSANFKMDGKQDIGVVCSFARAGIEISRSALVSENQAVTMNGTKHTLKLKNFDARLAYSITASIAGQSVPVSNDSIHDGVVDITVNEDYCDYITGSIEGMAQIEITAFRDGENVGTSYNNITVLVPETVIPIIRITGSRIPTLKHNKTGDVVDFGEYIQNGSSIQLSGNIWPPHHSPIKTVILYGDGFSNEIEYSESSSTITTTDIPINKKGLQTFILKATDSRGREAIQEFTLTAYEYHALQAKPRYERALTDGTPNAKGAYLKFYNKYDMSPVNSKNSLVLTKLTIKAENTSQETVLLPESRGVTDNHTYIFDTKLDPNKNYILTFSYSDKASSRTDRLMLVSSVATLSLFAGGRGVAIGKEADRDGFDCNYPATFSSSVDIIGKASTGSLSIAGEDVSDYPVAQGYTSSWHWRKWASGIAECWGVMDYSGNCTIPWGGLYEGYRWVFNDYPFTFVDIPTISVVGVGVSWNVCGLELEARDSVEDNLKIYPPDYHVLRPTEAPDMFDKINFIARGRWK